MNNTNIIITLIIVYLFYYNITIDNQKSIEINMIFMLQIEQSNKNIIKYDRQIEQSNNIMKTLEEYRKEFLKSDIDFATGKSEEDFHYFMRKKGLEHYLSKTQIQNKNK